MQFYGADTQLLRDHGRATHRGAAALSATGGGIAEAVDATPWAGTDAEAFRLRTFVVRRQIEQTVERLSAFGALLAEEAEEQDLCSAATSGGGIPTMMREGGFDGLLSGPWGQILGGLSSGHEPSAGIGFGGMGTGMQNSLGTPIDPAVFTPDTETTTTSGTSVEHGGRKATNDVTTSSDGSVTESVTFEGKAEFPVGSEAAGGKATFTVSETAEVTIHPDGSRTVTFEGAVGGAAEVHGQVKGVEVGAESSVTATGSFSVTLPPGVPLSEAASVNPFDPDTIPPGGSVTISGDLTAGAGASVGYKDVVSGSLGIEKSAEYVTTIAKDEHGALTLDRGPGTLEGIDYGLQIGPDDANISIDGSTATKTTTIQHAEFENSEAGTAAFKEMMLGGDLPGPEASGVTDAYTDVRKSVASDITFSAEVSGGGTEQHTSFGSSEARVFDVERTYPDGSWVREERYSAQGQGVVDDSSPYGVVHSSSETAPQYELVYPINGNAAPNSYHDQYGIPFSSEDQTARIVLTEQEMQQILENKEEYGGNPRTALIVYASQDINGADRMAEDFNDTGGSPAPGEAPGRLLEEGESGRPVPSGVITTPTPRGPVAMPSIQ